MSSAIKTENLTHIYSKGTPFEMVALNKINIEIKKGELIGVIGHTGSGKSTLMSHLNGLLKPHDGKIYIDGEDVWANDKDVRKFRFKVGLVFQYPEYQLFEETVYKDIAFGPRNMRLSEEEIEERVKEAAKYAGVKSDWLDKSPFELSGGQKRRVAIAGVIAMKPSILILDEPIAGLDPTGRQAILNMINNYHKETGSTILLISHSMEDIAVYADRVLVLKDGDVFAFDTVNKVFSQKDELRKIGLDLPVISEILSALNQAGYTSLKTDIHTPHHAALEIDRLIKEVKNA